MVRVLLLCGILAALGCCFIAAAGSGGGGDGGDGDGAGSVLRLSTTLLQLPPLLMLLFQSMSACTAEKQKTETKPGNDGGIECDDAQPGQGVFVDDGRRGPAAGASVVGVVINLVRWVSSSCVLVAFGVKTAAFCPFFSGKWTWIWTRTRP